MIVVDHPSSNLKPLLTVQEFEGVTVCAAADGLDALEAVMASPREQHALNKPIQVLLLEDRATDAELMIHELVRAGFTPKWTRVETAPDFLAEIKNLPDIILSDYSMPHLSGLQAAELLHDSGLNIPFILISGTVGEDVAVEAMQHGATDYLLKDRLGRLGIAVERALEQKRLRTIRQLAVAARTQAEEDLLKAKAQLADRAGQLERLVVTRTTDLCEATKQMEIFVYSIAHDLRSPLRSVQGFAEILLADPGSFLSANGKDCAEHINKSAQFMDALLRDLLEFSRVCQQRVRFQPVNLGEVIGFVREVLQQEITSRYASLNSSGQWPTVLAHEAIVTQVLTNLVSNALKFGVRDRPTIVRLWAEELPPFIRVWVEDNGIGIAPAQQDNIFKLFTRLHGARYQGTGVGLAIVKTGIERMGGRVGLESAAGRGCRFWFELQKV